MDPEERIRFRNVLADIGEQDVSVILSTHIVGDISSTCKNIAVLNKGQLAFRGTPEEFVEKAEGKVWELTVNDQEFETIMATQKLQFYKKTEIDVVQDAIQQVPGNLVWKIHSK